jgi:hypothetical protein
MTTPAKAKRRTATQLAADGFAALVEKLGMADAIRYVQLYDQGEGDYSQDRHLWLDPLTHEEVARLMVNAEKKRSSRRREK